MYCTTGTGNDLPSALHSEEIWKGFEMGKLLLVTVPMVLLALQKTRSLIHTCKRDIYCFSFFRFFGCFDFEEVQRLHLSSFSFFCVATAFVISSALRFIKEVFISEVKKM